jgi:hypothetical protein
MRYRNFQVPIPQMNKASQEYANRIAAGGGTLVHSCQRDDCEYSENLGMMPPSRDMATSANQSIHAWYDEIKGNNLETGESSEHFTALLWKDSRKVGIGATRKDNGYNYIVAQFTPAGKLEGN